MATNPFFSAPTHKASLSTAHEPVTALPAGMVTFLFTDIQGSTPLWERMPGEMKAALAQHHAILRAAIEANGGHVYQVIGDAFQAAFRLATSALAAALAAQRGLRDASWGPTGPLRVRMGLHTGPAEIDRQGNAPYEVCHTLNRTGRVMSAAHGGQILLTQETAVLVSHELPAGVSLQDLGEFPLKGLQRLEHLFQATAPDLPHSFPPPTALSTSRNNLPVQTTAFIGREKEIGEVALLLTQHRLVTLTGSGGTGKTRLSLQVAADTLHRYPQGAWLVELAPLSDPGKIAHSVAAALGLQETGELAVLAMLTDYLKNRQLLLVLDNCEHLVEASARLVDHLLHTSPGLVVLASSREALGIAGELSYRVPSLTIPDRNLPADFHSIAEAEAVSLFVDRARLLMPGFQLSAHNAPAVVEICRRLDGIPLAIELAAARVTALSVEKIAARLNDRFRLLTGGSRTALPRQQTLRASIDWSYSQLVPEERLLLQRLSVFAGGWTLEAAETVCGHDPVESYEVLDVLTSLVSKSLAAFSGETSTTHSTEPRYRLLETIRQYAREKMLDDGGGEDVRRQHLAYYLALSHQAADEFHGPQQRKWMVQLDPELDNFRAALEWGLADEDSASFLFGLDLISTLCTLDPAWVVFDIQEALLWLARYRSDPQRSALVPDHLRAKALYATGNQHFHQSRFSLTYQAFTESLDLCRKLGDAQLQFTLLRMMPGIADWVDKQDLKEQQYSELISVANQVDSYQNNLAVMHHVQGHIAAFHGERELAKQHYAQAVESYEQQGDILDHVMSLYALAFMTSEDGAHERAYAYFQKCVALCREMNIRALLGWSLFYSGDVAYRLGYFQEMERFFQEAQLASELNGFRRGPVWAQHHIGVAARRMGLIERAIQSTLRSLEMAEEYDAKEMISECLGSLAGLAFELGRGVESARLLGAFNTIRGHWYLGFIINEEVRLDLPRVKALLGEAAFEQAYREGQALTLEAAVRLGRAAVSGAQ